MHQHGGANSLATSPITRLLHGLSGKICKAHDDYIWAVEAGSFGKTRGKAGFSVYDQCDESQEERADEIFKKDFAPLFDKYVAAGRACSR